MIYSDLFLKKQRRIHTVFFIPFILIIFGILLYKIVPAQNTQASKKTLQKIEVVNLYPTHAGIVWQTQEKDQSWIVYGARPDKLDQIAFDVRDISEIKNPRTLHYADLKDLIPNTKYYFRMTDGKSFLQTGSEGFFSITTAPKDAQINNLKPAYGKLIGRNGSPVSGALITVTIPDTYTLAAVTKNSGEWLIPLNYIINRTTNKSQTVDQNQEVILKATDDTKLQSLVRTRLSRMSPLGENIVLGENYEINDNNQVLAANTNLKLKKLAILFPKKNSVIPSAKPLIKGLSSPDRDVTVELSNSKRVNIISARVHASDAGEWKYDVAVPLDPGTYTLTVNAVDSATRRNTVQSHAFTIAKSGEQVLGDATGSATVTPTPTVNVITATPTAGPTATPSPTLQVSPTVVATASATPTATVTATATPVPPVSGIAENNIVLSSIAFIVLGLGLLVVFK